MYKLFGIPNCDTVKKARTFLEKKSVPVNFIDFKKSPPTKVDIERWKVAFGGFNFLQRSLMVAHEAWCISSDPLEVTASVSRIPSDPLEVTVSRCGTATASQKVTFGHASIAA